MTSFFLHYKTSIFAVLSAVCTALTSTGVIDPHIGSILSGIFTVLFGGSAADASKVQLKN